MSNSEPAASDARRVRTRILVAVHVAAVLVIYALALLAGGGFAVPPFPPDLPSRVQVLAEGPPKASTAAPTPEIDAQRQTQVPASTGATDPPPPWRLDADGRAHWRTE